MQSTVDAGVKGCMLRAQRCTVAKSIAAQARFRHAKHSGRWGQGLHVARTEVHGGKVDRRARQVAGRVKALAAVLHPGALGAARCEALIPGRHLHLQVRSI